MNDNKIFEDRKPDYDLVSLFGNNEMDIKLSDIKNILALIPGEADGPSWHWVVELHTGAFAVIIGWCDYTGWDCQSGGSMQIASTPEEAAKISEYSEQLIKQLKGKQPYGLKYE